MSLFKSTGIILKKERREKYSLFTLFTYEYGKILLKISHSTPEKKMDIGYIINFEIKVKEKTKIHSISNIHIKSVINYSQFGYEIIFEYLQLITLLLYKTPFEHPIPNIFDAYEGIHHINILTEEKIIFIQLFCLFRLGILPENHKNVTIQKILQFIKKSHPKDILKLTGLKKYEKNLLQILIQDIIKK